MQYKKDGNRDHGRVTEPSVRLQAVEATSYADPTSQNRPFLAPKSGGVLLYCIVFCGVECRLAEALA